MTKGTPAGRLATRRARTRTVLVLATIFAAASGLLATPALAVAPFDGTTVSAGLGPTFGDPWCAHGRARLEHREPAGLAARADPVRGDRLHAHQDPERGDRRLAPAPDGLLDHRAVRGRARQVRRRRERARDARAAARLRALAAAPGDRAHRPHGRADPARLVGRRREDAGLHRGEHPRGRGRGRGRDHAGPPRHRDHAVRREPDRGQDPGSHDPHRDPEPEPGRPLHRPRGRTGTTSTSTATSSSSRSRRPATTSSSSRSGSRRSGSRCTGT